ncbi:MAG TPA: ATP-binding cassette domain-containing protein, partial [Chthoniobacterales bacterium]|nr:ATP-binding cassette domain-containing protein [Chthoniobacterales bacterium]
FIRAGCWLWMNRRVALSDRETARLFEIVRQLRSGGLAIIYISHRMAEVCELADRLSVLRDGEYVGELKRSEFSADKVIEMMVGRKVEEFYERTNHTAAGVVLDVKNVGDGKRVKRASFQLRKGEVVGLAGLVGAGRTELARLIFGADRRKTGEIFLNGRKLTIIYFQRIAGSRRCLRPRPGHARGRNLGGGWGRYRDRNYPTEHYETGDGCRPE